MIRKELEKFALQNTIPYLLLIIPGFFLECNDRNRTSVKSFLFSKLYFFHMYNIWIFFCLNGFDEIFEHWLVCIMYLIIRLRIQRWENFSTFCKKTWLISYYVSHSQIAVKQSKNYWFILLFKLILKKKEMEKIP